ncbi:MAG: HAMP domain-containing histidine kinase [Chitinispirillaceae bacterium]|nr:HAMP domain-containing histidine kinase [Chitinispirillaceae bacterium]
MMNKSNVVAGIRKNGLFIKPFRKVAVDLALFFLINAVFMYMLLFIIPDSSMAMLSSLWVLIIAWRGGTVAGIIGPPVIYLSSFLALHLPPHTQIPLSYYFSDRIPGYIIGIAQAHAAGLIVGYISSLVHKLRNEISLRKKIQTDLEQKVAELNTFGHTVAHDLKNPLMIINMAITTLSREYPEFSEGKAKKMVGFIQNSTVNMMNIIESLLVFAGIRMMEHKSFSLFPVTECVDEALHRLAYNIEANHVVIRKPDSWPSVYGHAPWVTEVLVNYINNAIKYGGNSQTGITPEIELGFDLPGMYTSPQVDHARIWVKDNGDGIPEEKADRLFREFSRLHSSRYEGHGLGLSIVKSVVDKLGGTVGFEPNQERGCRFYFTLPAQTPEQVA